MNILLLIIAALAISSLVRSKRLESDPAFVLLIKCYQLYSLIHVGYTAVALNMYGTTRFVDAGAPFAFGYGPLLYFGLLTAGTKLEGNIRKILVHFIPLPFMWASFILLLAYPDLRRAYMWNYYAVLTIGQCLSLLGYGFYSMYKVGSSEFFGKLGNKSRLINLGGTLLLFMASFGAVIFFSRVMPQRTVPPTLGLFIIYGFILSAQLSVAAYIHRSIRNQGTQNQSPVKTDQGSSGPVMAYEKSGIPLEILEEYNKRMQRLIAIEPVYLESSFSADKLAQMLDIEPHYLSQMFSRIHGKSFVTYINRLRIDYACLLLDGQEDFTLDQVAIRSGFSSKSTFNRVFKNIKGQTPSAYRNSTIG